MKLTLQGIQSAAGWEGAGIRLPGYDVRALAEMGLYGAIIGKAYYTGAIDLKEALEAAK